jgi:hypothetical protein
VSDTNIIQPAQPETFSYSLTEILRNGARTLLTQVVETEVADFLGRYASRRTRPHNSDETRSGPGSLKAVGSGRPVCGQLFGGSNELGEHRAGFCSGRNTAQDTWTPSSKVDLINAWLGGGILGDCND